MTAVDTKNSSSTDSFCPDCSPFLNWDEEQLASESEQAAVFRSLVASVKFQPSFDVSLETKAVNFLGSVDLYAQESADAILNSFGQTTDESLTIFIQYILVLVSTPNHVIKTAAMKMLYSLSLWCSPNIRLALVKADLLPQIVINLNLQSLSFAEAVDIHIHIMKIIRISAWLTAPDGLDQLEIEDHDEQQAVYKTVLKQVLVPSEKYICYLCANRYSMNDETQSESFVLLLATLLRISPSYQPTMDFVLHMPVVLTIPSCLTYSRSDC